MRLISFNITFIFFFYGFQAAALINALELDHFPDVVRLEFSNGWVCSGVFLNRTTILTAAHCLVPEAEKSSFKIVKIKTLNKKLIEVNPTEYLPHPQFKHQKWHIHDVGLIKTTENIDFERNLEIDIHQPSQFGQAQLYGCGKVLPSGSQYSRAWGRN